MFPTEKETALAETLRVLKPGGTLVATTWDILYMMPLARDVMTDILGKEPPTPDLNPMCSPKKACSDPLVEGRIRVRGASDIDLSFERANCAARLYARSEVPLALARRAHEAQPRVGAEHERRRRQPQSTSTSSCSPRTASQPGSTRASASQLRLPLTAISDVLPAGSAADRPQHICALPGGQARRRRWPAWPRNARPPGHEGAAPGAVFRPG